MVTRHFLGGALLVMVLVAPATADDYTVDPTHTYVGFKISHIGLSWTYGRFNNVKGMFSIDSADPEKCSFTMIVKIDSIDTGNNKRDEHLRSPDFFNVNQFPALTFQSTTVKPIKDGYQVTGNLTMHGVTKSVTFALLGGRKAEFPKGVQRTGYSTGLILKRSEFGMDKMLEAIGDDVNIEISFEGAKK